MYCCHHHCGHYGPYPTCVPYVPAWERYGYRSPRRPTKSEREAALDELEERRAALEAELRALAEETRRLREQESD